MTKRSGFTLVEVLVVVAVIAILLAILAPTMGRVGVLAERTTCGSNIHQLGPAWTEDAISNEMSLVEAHTHGSSWVDSGGTLEAIQDGKLWPHTGSAGIYKCPTPVYDYATSYSISGGTTSSVLADTFTRCTPPTILCRGGISRTAPCWKACNSERACVD